MENNLEELINEIEQIKLRNKQVEENKAWETSTIRKLSICVLTYFVMCTVMYSIGVKDFYISAIVPTLGFFLSTLSLPFIKKIWIRNRY